MDGTDIEFGSSPDGSMCGIWVDTEGQPEIEMVPVKRPT
jgi:hypothetical protein